jgi:nucleotide-binding universal stress UspA family protein
MVFPSTVALSHEEHPMYRSLLVPLDGTPFGEQALPLALSIASRAGASLEIVHVHTPFEYYRVPSAVAPQMDEQARKDKRAYLDGIVSRLAAEGKAKAISTLLIGHAADAIHDHAVSKGTDLVVLTTQGRGPVSRFWMGSVADNLMRRLPMPVLLARPQETEPDMTQERLRNQSSRTLQERPAPSRRFGAGRADSGTSLGAGHVDASRIHPPVGVVDPILEFDEDIRGRRSIAFSPSLLAEVKAARQWHEAEARSYLNQVANRLRSEAHRVKVRIAQNLKPAAAILNDASDPSIDIVALATQGRGGLARMFLGSVADKVVRGATTPGVRPYSSPPARRRTVGAGPVLGPA